MHRIMRNNTSSDEIVPDYLICNHDLDNIKVCIG